MDYAIELGADGKIVFAAAHGEWDAAIDNAMIRQIMETVNSTGVSKVFLDMRDLHFDFPIVQIFERAKEVRQERRKHDKVSTRTALVYSPVNAKREQDMAFFETTSRNRGLPYAIFRDADEAIKWLLDDAR